MESNARSALSTAVYRPGHEHDNKSLGTKGKYVVEVADGIHRMELEYTPLGLATYALIGERTVLVDAGYAGASGQIDAYLRHVGRRLAQVEACVITHAHADHYGAASEVQTAAPGAVFAVHPLDRAWVEDPDEHIRANDLGPAAFGLPVAPEVFDRVRGMLGPAVHVQKVLNDGDVVDVGGGWRLEVIHAPGHTPGHLALLDRRSNTLLAGDAVLEPDVLPPAYYDALVYMKTLERLMAISARRLLGSHYAMKEGRDVGAFVRRALAHARECHDVVREVLATAQEPVHLAAVAEALRSHFALGDTPQRWTWGAYGHLVALERVGEAVRRSWNGLPAWERQG